MSTPAQIAANQANAEHSTGPVSPHGKAISARNRLTYGFRSATVLLPGDDRAEYEDLLAELSEHLGATDLTEERLIREMADAEWRLRRVRRYMESAFSRHMARLAEENPPMDPLDLQALAVETLGAAGSSHATCSYATCSYATWLRYETKFERQYDRAYNTWSRYQDCRRRNASQDAETLIQQPLAPPLSTPAADDPKLGSKVQIARGAPCPCGSGNKYKRCCGHDAPPLLHVGQALSPAVSSP